MEVLNTTFIIMQHWMLASEYAKACGVSSYAITQRIKNGRVSAKKIDGEWVVDAACTPPLKKLPGWKVVLPAFQWPATMPPSHELVWVERLVRARNMRSDRVYRAILFGKIRAWGVSGRVLVSKAETLANIGI